MGDTRQDQLFEVTRDMPGLELSRAKRYSRIRLAGMAIGAGLWGARTTAFALSGRSSGLRRALGRATPNQTIADALFIASTMVASNLARLPIEYGLDYRVERAFGLTTQSTRGWLTDQAKGLGVGLALQTPLTLGAYTVIRRRPTDWWLVLAGLTVPVAVALSQLAPVLLMPLFNTFEPLDDEELDSRIRELATRAGMPISDVYRMDMSRHSEKANAFFTGIGRTKRIVLADTLLARFDAAEIEGVVAHELGHQVHGDIWRLVGMFGAFMTGSLYVGSKMAPELISRTRNRTDARDVGDVAGLPLLALTLAGFGALAGPVQAAASRAIERRTDQFAVELTGDGETYARAMARLAEQNLADPDPPRLLVWLLGSHPPIADRIRAARRFDLARSGRC